jgi:flavin-dependent dehydrogenase
MTKAVVIGGGIAGLAAAKVLSPHFKQVIIYDKGEIKQSLHQHVLLKSGQTILENLFPGIKKKLAMAGCLEIDWAKDTLWENFDGSFPRYDSSVKTLSMSRTLLQKMIIKELASMPNIQFQDERVEKVSDLDAALVVVAGGQNFALTRFLGKIYSEEKSLSINLTYRSYVFNQSELELDGFKQYYYQIDPPKSLLGGVICPIEDGKAMVTIIEKELTISKCESYADFLNKAKQIPGGTFYGIIKNAQPLTSMAIFRKIHTYRRILDEKKIPKGVVIIGDVLNSLNPVFGQGMTLSLMQVEVLGEMLLSKKFDEKNFHIKCNSLGFVPYLLSKTGSEEKSFGKIILRLYLQLCQKSQGLHHHFLKVLHGLGSPGKAT